jgi:hypothetical protein
MNEKLKINFRQKQIIMGKLLGDAHLETTNNKTYRLKFEHSFKQKEYVDWLYEELGDLATSEPKTKQQTVNGKVYQKYWFNTKYSGSFRFYGQQFYAGKKKVVPKLIKRWLTPICLAVWFMDDGSIKSKQCQAKIFNTQAFDKKDVERLQTAILQNFQIETQQREQKEGLQIYVPAKEVEKFRKVIDNHMIDSMRYKLG